MKSDTNSWFRKKILNTEDSSYNISSDIIDNLIWISK
jgi:hypothetical protein